MKVLLLENQIELILKSLENYSVLDKEKMQLIYATYESLLDQLNTCKQEKSRVTESYKNVIKM